MNKLAVHCSRLLVFALGVAAAPAPAQNKPSTITSVVTVDPLPISTSSTSSFPELIPHSLTSPSSYPRPPATISPTVATFTFPYPTASPYPPLPPLPCTPNQLYCNTLHSFSLCAEDIDDGTNNGTRYALMGSTATGTVCFLEGDGTGNLGRIGAENAGSCSVEGSLSCGAGGKTFFICDHGAYSMYLIILFTDSMRSNARARLRLSGRWPDKHGLRCPRNGVRG